jgi:two-component system, NtrC family, sensor kinase
MLSRKLGKGWLLSLLAGPSSGGPGKPARPRKKARRRKPAQSGMMERPCSARVLVIDDERQVAAALKRLLRRHEVTLAGSGEEARELLAKKAFDVIVSDVMMPDFSGIDLYMELAAQGSPLVARFIFVTGGVHGSKAHKFLAGIDNPRLDKPVDALELEHAIARVLNGNEAGAGAG